jgi:hypothetical protein
MSIDNTRNFARAWVSGTYDSTATVIQVQNPGYFGDSDILHLPDAPFKAVWWNSTDFPNPVDDIYAEIIRVIDISGLNLTIERAVEEAATHPATDKNIASKTYALEVILTANRENETKASSSDKLVITSLQHPPTNGPTAALAGAGAGNCTNGVHHFKTTYSTSEGETDGSPLEVGGTVTVSDNTTNGKIRVTIPYEGNQEFVGFTGNSGVNLYMTEAGGSNYYLVAAFFAPNIGSVVVDESDATLVGSGTPLPSTNTTANPLFSAGGAIETDGQNPKAALTLNQLTLATQGGNQFVLQALWLAIGDILGVGNSTSITIDDANMELDLISGGNLALIASIIKHAGHIGTDQAVDASVVPTSINKKIPIYDNSGTLICYLAGYSSIT